MSNATTLARPYARAAFEWAESQNDLSGWEDALASSAALTGSREATQLLADPALSDQQLVTLLAPTNSSPRGYDNFLAVLAENSRLSLLPEIADQYAVLKDAAEQTVTVTVTSARELDEDRRHQLERSLAKRFGRNIELTAQVDESMMGGARIQAGDLVIDGSVRSKLERLAAALTL